MAFWYYYKLRLNSEELFILSPTNKSLKEIHIRALATHAVMGSVSDLYRHMKKNYFPN